MSRARPWRSRPTSRSSPTGCTRSSLASETRSRVSCTATCPSFAPSCASTATTRTSTSSSTASAKPPRSSGSSPTRPRHPLMGTTPRCPGGGKRMAVSGEEGRWFALVGAFLPIVDEASPRCGGEASVLCSGSVLSRTLARVPSGGRSSLLAGVSEVCQLLFQ